MAKKKVETKNQDFKELMKKLNILLVENQFLDSHSNFSKMAFRDECDEECLDCRTFAETRPDPRRPGKTIIVMVRRCVRR